MMQSKWGNAWQGGGGQVKAGGIVARSPMLEERSLSAVEGFLHKALAVCRSASSDVLHAILNLRGLQRSTFWALLALLLTTTFIIHPLRISHLPPIPSPLASNAHVGPRPHRDNGVLVWWSVFGVGCVRRANATLLEESV